jgi:hypothetical protein
LTFEYQQPSIRPGEIRAALWGEKGVKKESKRRRNGGKKAALGRRKGGAFSSRIKR